MSTDFLTVSEAAKRFGVERTTVYMAIQERRINAVTIVGRVVIPKSELKKFRRRSNGNKTHVFRKKVA